MLTRVAIAVLVLVPLAASAQVQRAPFPGAPAGGITVAGRGIVRIPVKTLRFVAYARGPADEQAVIAAMRAAGIDEPAIGPAGSQITFNASAPTALRGVVHDVSQAKLERIAAAAADYVHAHPGVTLEGVQFSPRIDDCATFEETARTAALADARRKAQAIAAASSLGLGGVVAVNESGGCPAEIDSAFNNGPQSPLDLATLTTVLQVNEAVTYATVAAEQPGRRLPLSG